MRERVRHSGVELAGHVHPVRNPVKTPIRKGVIVVSLCYCPACHITPIRYAHSEDQFCEKTTREVV